MSLLFYIQLRSMLFAILKFKIFFQTMKYNSQNIIDESLLHIYMVK